MTENPVAIQPAAEFPAIEPHHLKKQQKKPTTLRLLLRAELSKRHWRWPALWKDFKGCRHCSLYQSFRSAALRGGRVDLWQAFRRPRLITPYYAIKNGRKDLKEVPFFSYIISVDASCFFVMALAKFVQRNLIYLTSASTTPKKYACSIRLCSPATFFTDAPPLSIRSALLSPQPPRGD